MTSWARLSSLYAVIHCLPRFLAMVNSPKRCRVSLLCLVGGVGDVSYRYRKWCPTRLTSHSWLVFSHSLVTRHSLDLMMKIRTGIKSQFVSLCDTLCIHQIKDLSINHRRRHVSLEHVAICRQQMHLRALDCCSHLFWYSFNCFRMSKYDGSVAALPLPACVMPAYPCVVRLELMANKSTSNQTDEDVVATIERHKPRHTQFGQ